MRVFLRALVCACVLAEILVPQEVAAQDYSYAVLLTIPKVRLILHCPYCNGNVLVRGGRTYIVRTGEGIDLSFDDVAIANQALQLLNWMARVSSECDRAEYEFAVGEYTKLMAFSRAQDDGLGPTGIFKLLHPKQALSPLVEYVVPDLHRCVTTRPARGVTGPSHQGRSVVSWSRH